MINVSDIRMEIAEMLREHFDANIDPALQEDLAANFFGMKYSMPPYFMLYLVLMLEHKYEICFNDYDYDSDGFYCLEGISDIIAQKISEKESA